MKKNDTQQQQLETSYLEKSGILLEDYARTGQKLAKRSTVEPTVALYYLSLSISNFLGNNLLLRKACDLDGVIGDNVTVPCPREKLAQLRVTSINSWKVPLTIFLSTVVVLILGVWSDRRHKRSFMIFLPIVGHILTDLACCLNVYFWSWRPELLAAFESILPGITGHRNSVWIGAICYVSDNSTERNRTFRIGVLNAIYYICSPIGAGIAGTLNVKLGFMNTFLISAALNAIGLIFGYLLMNKSASIAATEIQSTSRTDETNHDGRNRQRRQCDRRRDHLLMELFKSYRVFFKPRKGNRRLKVLLMTLVAPVVIGRMVGEGTVMYLFVRYKFQWNEVDYSIFTAYKMVTILIGTLFSIGLLSHYLKINDALIGIVGTSVDTIAAVLYFMVSSSFQMYIIPLVDMFHGAALTLAASISTKCVESNELGKLNTMQAVLSALFPIIISPLYSQVYSLTFEKMPSVFFIISIIISIPTVVLFSIVYYMITKYESPTNNTTDSIPAEQQQSGIIICTPVKESVHKCTVQIK